MPAAAGPSRPGPGNSLHRTDKIPWPRHKNQKIEPQRAAAFPCRPCRLLLVRVFPPCSHLRCRTRTPPTLISSSCCLACSHSRALTHLRIHSCHPFPHSLTNDWFSLSDLFSLASRPDRPAHRKTAHQPDRPRAFVSQARWAGMIRDGLSAVHG